MKRDDGVTRVACQSVQPLYRTFSGGAALAAPAAYVVMQRDPIGVVLSSRKRTFDDFMPGPNQDMELLDAANGDCGRSRGIDARIWHRHCSFSEYGNGSSRHCGAAPLPPPPAPPSEALPYLFSNHPYYFPDHCPHQKHLTQQAHHHIACRTEASPQGSDVQMSAPSLQQSWESPHPSSHRVGDRHIPALPLLMPPPPLASPTWLPGSSCCSSPCCPHSCSTASAKDMHSPHPAPPAGTLLSQRYSQTANLQPPHHLMACSDSTAMAAALPLHQRCPWSFNSIHSPLVRQSSHSISVTNAGEVWLPPPQARSHFRQVSVCEERREACTTAKHLPDADNTTAGAAAAAPASDDTETAPIPTGMSDAASLLPPPLSPLPSAHLHLQYTGSAPCDQPTVTMQAVALLRSHCGGDGGNAAQSVGAGAATSCLVPGGETRGVVSLATHGTAPEEATTSSGAVFPVHSASTPPPPLPPPSGLIIPLPPITTGLPAYGHLQPAPLQSLPPSPQNEKQQYQHEASPATGLAECPDSRPCSRSAVAAARGSGEIQNCTLVTAPSPPYFSLPKGSSKFGYVTMWSRSMECIWKPTCGATAPPPPLPPLQQRQVSTEVPPATCSGGSGTCPGLLPPVESSAQPSHSNNDQQQLQQQHRQPQQMGNVITTGNSIERGPSSLIMQCISGGRLLTAGSPVPGPPAASLPPPDAAVAVVPSTDVSPTARSKQQHLGISPQYGGSSCRAKSPPPPVLLQRANTTPPNAVTTGGALVQCIFPSCIPCGPFAGAGTVCIGGCFAATTSAVGTLQPQCPRRSEPVGWQLQQPSCVWVQGQGQTDLTQVQSRPFACGAKQAGGREAAVVGAGADSSGIWDLADDATSSSGCRELGSGGSSCNEAAAVSAHAAALVTSSASPQRQQHGEVETGKMASGKEEEEGEEDEGSDVEERGGGQSRGQRNFEGEEPGEMAAGLVAAGTGQPAAGEPAVDLPQPHRHPHPNINSHPKHFHSQQYCTVPNSAMAFTSWQVSPGRTGGQGAGAAAAASRGGPDACAVHLQDGGWPHTRWDCPAMSPSGLSLPTLSTVGWPMCSSGTACTAAPPPPPPTGHTASDVGGVLQPRISRLLPSDGGGGRVRASYWDELEPTYGSEAYVFQEPPMPPLSSVMLLSEPERDAAGATSVSGSQPPPPSQQQQQQQQPHPQHRLASDTGPHQSHDATFCLPVPVPEPPPPPPTMHPSGPIPSHHTAPCIQCTAKNSSSTPPLLPPPQLHLQAASSSGIKSGGSSSADSNSRRSSYSSGGAVATGVITSMTVVGALCDVHHLGPPPPPPPPLAEPPRQPHPLQQRCSSPATAIVLPLGTGEGSRYGGGDIALHGNHPYSGSREEPYVQYQQLQQPPVVQPPSITSIPVGTGGRGGGGATAVPWYSTCTCPMCLVPGSIRSPCACEVCRLKETRPRSLDDGVATNLEMTSQQQQNNVYLDPSKPQPALEAAPAPAASVAPLAHWSFSSSPRDLQLPQPQPQLPGNSTARPSSATYVSNAIRAHSGQAILPYTSASYPPHFPFQIMQPYASPLCSCMEGCTISVAAPAPVPTSAATVTTFDVIPQWPPTAAATLYDKAPSPPPPPQVVLSDSGGLPTLSAPPSCGASCSWPQPPRPPSHPRSVHSIPLHAAPSSSSPTAHSIRQTPSLQRVQQGSLKTACTSAAEQQQPRLQMATRPPSRSHVVPNAGHFLSGQQAASPSPLQALSYHQPPQSIHQPPLPARSNCCMPCCTVRCCVSCDSTYATGSAAQGRLQEACSTTTAPGPQYKPGACVFSGCRMGQQVMPLSAPLTSPESVQPAVRMVDSSDNPRVSPMIAAHNQHTSVHESSECQLTLPFAAATAPGIPVGAVCCGCGVLFHPTATSGGNAVGAGQQPPSQYGSTPPSPRPAASAAHVVPAAAGVMHLAPWTHGSYSAGACLRTSNMGYPPSDSAAPPPPPPPSITDVGRGAHHEWAHLSVPYTNPQYQPSYHMPYQVPHMHPPPPLMQHRGSPSGLATTHGTYESVESFMSPKASNRPMSVFSLLNHHHLGGPPPSADEEAAMWAEDPISLPWPRRGGSRLM